MVAGMFVMFPFIATSGTSPDFCAVYYRNKSLTESLLFQSPGYQEVRSVQQQDQCHFPERLRLSVQQGYQGRC